MTAAVKCYLTNSLCETQLARAVVFFFFYYVFLLFFCSRLKTDVKAVTADEVSLLIV